MDTLSQLFPHLVLPAAVPCAKEHNLDELSSILGTRVIQACNELARQVDGGMQQQLYELSAALATCMTLRQSSLAKGALTQEFESLHSGPPLILHLEAQNAALLFRTAPPSNAPLTIIIEAFESAPTNAAVLAAESALTWDFPGAAIAIEWRHFSQAPLQASLATFLEQANSEILSTFQPQSHKAGTSIDEVRETAHPGLITEVLFPVLEATAKPVSVPILRKHIRDDVYITKQALPWRRMSFWLVLKVACQRLLCLHLGSDDGLVLYKCLVALLLSRYLTDAGEQLQEEDITILRAKLCRRMVKLEALKTHIDNKQLIVKVGDIVRSSVEQSTQRSARIWNSFKQQIMRPIPKIQRTADQASMILTLPNSHAFLTDLVDRYSAGLRSTSNPDRSRTQSGLEKLIVSYASLVSREIGLTSIAKSSAGSSDPSTCCTIAGCIYTFMRAHRSTYSCDFEHFSTFLLHIFELWISMDQMACKSWPLLQEYAPVFRADLLNVLQLPLKVDMQRLQVVQQYLAGRLAACRYPATTILSRLDHDSFAARFGTSSQEIRQRLADIQTETARARDGVRAAYNTAVQEHGRLSSILATTACVCVVGTSIPAGSNKCPRCAAKNARKKLKVVSHEDPLPTDTILQAAIVFETLVPRWFAHFRDTTWTLVRDFCHPSRSDHSSACRDHLEGDPALKKYFEHRGRIFALSSRVKRFNSTHYRIKEGTGSLSMVLLPLGATYEYRDDKANVWAIDLDKPLTLQHLGRLPLPAVISPILQPDDGHPPSSAPSFDGAEIQANQLLCPPALSVHEFSSFQKIMSGTSRVWLNLLVELGSSNIGLSNEAAAHTFARLATQAGPAANGHVLRDMHAIFEEQSFVQQLLHQIQIRLHAIGENWRELHLLDLLVTLIFRVSELTTGTWNGHVRKLLRTCRRTAVSWVTHHRQDFAHSRDQEQAAFISRHIVSACLICRRILLSNPVVTLQGSDNFAEYLSVSLALQEHLGHDPNLLSSDVRASLLRDCKQASKARPHIANTTDNDTSALLNQVIKDFWGDNSDVTTTRWIFNKKSERLWATTWLTSKYNGVDSTPQQVHWDLVNGILTVDGKTQGKLPDVYWKSGIVTELLGHQHILTYPSSLPGMAHRVASTIRGHEIHLGLVDNVVVVQAMTRTCRLHLVPRDIFRNAESFDIPSALVHDRIHWLNLEDGILIMRQKQDPWNDSRSDWTLDVRSGICMQRKVRLVNPGSSIFQDIANLFADFEAPQRLLVAQRESQPLSVELKHLGLSFFVNSKGLLECRELRAEFDPDQDAGTLYGLRSKIVLRDTLTHKRSIIMPLSEVSWKRSEVHMDVLLAAGDAYARYEIDDLLGRLTHPPEPALTFALARVHAMTSFPIPDPLTGQTGGEQALEILKTASSKPWTKLGAMPVLYLKDVLTLSPKRDYYPAHKRVQQQVKWSAHATKTIQRDEYEDLVLTILNKSDSLAAFDSGHGEPTFRPAVTSHLRLRAILRRDLYERYQYSSPYQRKKRESRYESRDTTADSRAEWRAFDIAVTLLHQPFSIRPSIPLAHVLQGCPQVGGFGSGDSTWSLASLTDPDLILQFGRFVQFCRNALDPHQVLFTFGLIAYTRSLHDDVLLAAAALVNIPALKTIQLPFSPDFSQPRDYGPPPPYYIQDVVRSTAIAHSSRSKRQKKADAASGLSYQQLCNAEVAHVTPFILSQWPLPAPNFHNYALEYHNAQQILQVITREWTRRLGNHFLMGFCQAMQWHLDQVPWLGRPHRPAVPRYDDRTYLCSTQTLRAPVPSLMEVATNFVDWCETPSPTMICDPAEFDPIQSAVSATALQKADALMRILEVMRVHGNSTRQQYASDLIASLKACQQAIAPEPSDHMVDVFTCTLSLDIAAKSLQETEAQLLAALAAATSGSQWLHLGGLWPHESLTSLLKLLRPRQNLPRDSILYSRLIALAVAITVVQRLKRLQTAWTCDNIAQVKVELANCGHHNWVPSAYPDWLLLEIDGNFLIRDEQVDVALAIISPPTDANSVLQMNMGKGKTSCIVPMALAVFADTRRLCRLIVPKALLHQTAQVLQARIGGLVGREVTHVPFTRSTKTTAEWTSAYTVLHFEALKTGGVMVTTPEHLQSFKLVGWQCLIDGNGEAAKRIFAIEKNFGKHYRDVIDESDFTLGVKTQLIYPSGSNIAFDGQALRWKVIQDLLSLLEMFIDCAAHRHTRSIKVVRRDKGFPILQLLDRDAEEIILDSLVNAVCNNGASMLRLKDDLSTYAKDLLRHVLSSPQLEEQHLMSALACCDNHDTAYTVLLVLRGLLAHRILVSCLKKRWNVQYGLHPGRIPLAVPFEAKGVPSERAEFGHPDVALTLTCLATYYSGLTMTQFKDSLSSILRSDDPAVEFGRWSSQSDAALAKVRWDTINLEDLTQMESLHRKLKLQRPVVNYFLNSYVFPQYAKQYEVKIQASAWDIPLTDWQTGHPTINNAVANSARTTGFSGTNDNRTMLPLTIKQNDLEGLRGTNAEVLLHLLEDRNRHFVTAADNGQRFTEVRLLKCLHKAGIRILIDAGAFVLEKGNRDLVIEWLSIDGGAKAGLYFDSEHRPYICRAQETDGEDIPLLASQYVNDLSECVVYLDEAHTRGVDLQLPPQARGALTLALGQTKDHTVQAAMRLRKLGTTQSVAFFGPPEVDQSIRDVCGIGPNDHVASIHVVAWLLDQTCKANENIVGLFRSQGADYCRRMDMQLRRPDFLHNILHRDQLLQVLTRAERRSLKEMYGCNSTSLASEPLACKLPQFQGFVSQLKTIDTDAIHTSVFEEVEQEREIQLEVEEVRMAERPNRPVPMMFTQLDPVIARFAECGTLLHPGKALIQVYDFVAKTALGRKYNIRGTEARLYVSAAFERTVKRADERYSIDDFIRPAEWLLYSPRTTTGIIVVPEEAELLLPILRNFNPTGFTPVARAHLIAYAAPVTANMQHFARCDYLSIPPMPATTVIPSWLLLDLGIFAGQLYTDYDSCKALGRYLGVTTTEDMEDEKAEKAGQGGMVRFKAGGVQKCTFAKNAVGFVLEWLSLRRKNQDVLHTPVGFVCHGRPLERDHVFFR